jgi:hypothetical protein
MSERTIRIRLRWGEKEFEIEGIVDKELKEKIDYLYEAFKLAIKEKPEKTEESKEKGASKKPKRAGGRKAPFYKGNIQRIMDEEPEWFVDKDAGAVAEKLKTEYGVPGAQEIPVSTALMRKFKKGLLTRKEENGKYFYSVVSTKK